jgi:hypothetical protein
MPVRRGLSDRVRLKELEEANERAVQRLRVSRDQERTNGAAKDAVSRAAEAPADVTRAAEAPADVSRATESSAGARAEPEPPTAETPTASVPESGIPSTTPETWLTHPDPLERVRWIALVAAKVATIAFAIDALVNPKARRFRGKAMRIRALGYIGTLFVVPAAWRLLPNRGRYPRGLDTAVSIPLLLDAAGNSLGIYEDAHVDDVVHVANAAIVSGVTGALVAPRVDERWQAALAAAGLGITGETLWEIMEYVAWRLGADGMNLSYTDTMDDIIESTLGAIVGGLFTLTRVPRSREERKKVGWRAPLGA